MVRFDKKLYKTKNEIALSHYEFEDKLRRIYLPHTQRRDWNREIEKENSFCVFMNPEEIKESDYINPYWRNLNEKN